MTDITVLNSKFEDAGKLSTNVELNAENIKEATVHQVVKATLAGRRQGTHSTKTRAFVSGGGAKPFKQKGTGRARQGTSRSGLMVGGARVFGPLPRNYDQKVNKKVTKVALQSIIADKLQAGKLTVVDSFESTGKTKDMFKTLNDKGLLPALVVTQDKNDPALKAARNLQWATSLPVEHFSIYAAVKYENLVIEKQALETLLNRLV
ncbi:MAG: 50S ribosomal protein L4 [Bdellovibrionota bacterium]|nr:50S ribosomal protein L4 [Bdellovibrionota bacterium]